jgi:3'(2'), 5'-bisphosphate nucleotidase
VKQQRTTPALARDEAQALLATACRAVLPASAAILRIYEEGNWNVEEKDDKSPLTRADREAHEIIARVLEEESPEVPVLSEEGAHLPFETRKTWERLWIVDPLDGTKEFLSRNGEFTVNVALAVGGTPVLGVVAVPALDTYYVAAGGHGAFRASGETVAAAAEARDPIAAMEAQAVRLAAAAGAGDTARAGAAAETTARVVASRSHLNAETEAFIEGLKTQYTDVTIVQAGSAVKLCRVAEGEADYYPRLAPTMEWDTAAGDAVVREAGGRVLHAAADGSSDGSELTYNKEDLHNPYFVAVAKGKEL